METWLPPGSIYMDWKALLVWIKTISLSEEVVCWRSSSSGMCVMHAPIYAYTHLTQTKGQRSATLLYLCAFRNLSFYALKETSCVKDLIDLIQKLSPQFQTTKLLCAVLWKTKSSAVKQPIFSAISAVCLKFAMGIRPIASNFCHQGS
jgi:hypothetical protein